MRQRSHPNGILHSTPLASDRSRKRDSRRPVAVNAFPIDDAVTAVAVQIVEEALAESEAGRTIQVRYRQLR